jgi:2',5'-phosphodiesterase
MIKILCPCIERHLSQLQVATVAQLTVLEPREPSAPEERPLCVANTHLFFHPRASHIRTLHAAAMLAEAAALMRAARPRLARAPSLLFCGDLNSDLNDGVAGTPLSAHCSSSLVS